MIKFIEATTNYAYGAHPIDWAVLLGVWVLLFVMAFAQRKTRRK